MSSLDSILNVTDFRKIARRKLPAPMFNYIDGGADDESNVLGNVHAFDRARLVPEYLVDVEKVKSALNEQGFFLQLPPPPENLLEKYKQERANQQGK